MYIYFRNLNKNYLNKKALRLGRAFILIYYLPDTEESSFEEESSLDST